VHGPLGLFQMTRPHTLPLDFGATARPLVLTRHSWDLTRDVDFWFGSSNPGFTAYELRQSL